MSGDKSYWYVIAIVSFVAIIAGCTRSSSPTLSKEQKEQIEIIKKEIEKDFGANPYASDNKVEVEELPESGELDISIHTTCAAIKGFGPAFEVWKSKGSPTDLKYRTIKQQVSKNNFEKLKASLEKDECVLAASESKKLVTNSDPLPIILSQPSVSSTLFRPNETLSLSVHVTSQDPTPQFYYQWYADNIPVPGENSKDFLISSLRDSDSAEYKVGIINGSSTEVFSDILDIKVSAPPPVIESFYEIYSKIKAEDTGVDTVFYKGNFTILRFHISNENNPFSADTALTFYYDIKWFKDGIEIPGKKSNTLALDNISEAITGNYSFTITNPLGESASPSSPFIIQTIEDPPAPTINGINVEIPDIAGAHTTRIFTGFDYYILVDINFDFPRLYNYQWYKNGQPVLFRNPADGSELPGNNPQLIRGRPAFAMINIPAEDAGTYYLEVSDNNGNTVNSDSITISPVYFPEIVSQPSFTGFASQNDTVELSFETTNGASDDSLLNISWYLDEELLVNNLRYSGVNSKILQISNFDLDTVGNYSARYTYKIPEEDPPEEEVHKTTQVFVPMAVKAEITNGPRSFNHPEGSVDQTPLEGQSYARYFELQLDPAELVPAYTYEWFKGTEPIPVGTGKFGLAGAGFFIREKQLDRSDSGFYKVVISANGLETISEEIELNVEFPPEITDQTSTTVYNLNHGDDLLLSFNYAANPEPQIKWYKNDIEIIGENTSSLDWPDLSGTQSGTYHAEISNVHGSVKTNYFYVQVDCIYNPVQDSMHISELQAPNFWTNFYDPNNKPDDDLIVAVIDTGVDYTHPNLVGQMWDDGAGNTGRNFSHTKNGGSFTDPIDISYHGTAVAGLIAATPTGAGSPGLAHESVKIMALNVYYSDPNGNYIADSEDIVNAIYYAVDNGADVINISSSHSGKLTSTVAAALFYATDNNVLVVASAGNDRQDINLFATNPKTFGSYGEYFPGFISVSSYKINSGQLSRSANYSDQFVNLVAPGEASYFYSTVPLQSNSLGYECIEGTSFSTALVSSAAALLKGYSEKYSSVNAQDLIFKPITLEGLISASADKDAALSSKVMDGNKLNISNSFSVANDILTTAPLSIDVPLVDLEIGPGGTLYFSVEVSGGQPPYTYDWFWKEHKQISWGRGLSSVTVEEVQYEFTNNFGQIESSSGPFSVVVTDANGSSVKSTAQLTVKDREPIVITTQTYIENGTIDLDGTIFNDSVLEDQDADIRVVAEGFPLGYQWYKDGSPVSGGQFEGENTANLKIRFVEPEDAGMYKVKIFNGDEEVFSDEVELFVLYRPRFSKNATPYFFVTDSSSAYGENIKNEGDLPPFNIDDEELLKHYKAQLPFTVDMENKDVYNYPGYDLSVTEKLYISIKTHSYPTQTSYEWYRYRGTLNDLTNPCEQGTLIPDQNSNLLTIDPLNVLEGGYYCVKAQNLKGSRESDYVFIFIKPHLTYSGKIDVPLGENFSYTTDFKVFDRDNFPENWYTLPSAQFVKLSDNTKYNGTNTQTLTINNVQKTDEFRYYYGTDWTDSKVSGVREAFSINVLFPPEISNVTPDTTVLAGTDITLQIDVDLDPDVTFAQWKKDGAFYSAVADSPTYYTKTDENSFSFYLVIPNIPVEDSGNYTLEVSNSEGTAESLPINIFVEEPPSILTGPDPTVLQVFEGSSGTFNLTYKGSPEPTATWFKGGLLLSTGGRFVVGSDASLTINSVEKSDSDTYTVSLDNGVIGSPALSNPVTLDVLFPPSFSSLEAENALPMPAGNLLVVNATADANPSPLFEWQVKKTSTGNWETIPGQTSSRLEYDTDGAVENWQIKAIAFQNFNGSDINHTKETIDVNFIFKPNITEDPNNGIDITVTENDSVSLTAKYNAYAGINDITITWRHNGSVIGVETGVSIDKTLTDTTLNFTNINRSKTGNYNVEVSNPTGTTVSNSIFIDVQYAPEFLTDLSPPSTLIVERGSFVDLNMAVVDSNPAADYQWHFKDNDSSDFSVINGEINLNLLFASIDLVNAGTYYLKATNSIGSTDSGPLYLDVHYPPEITQQPVEITVLEGNSASFTSLAVGNPTPSIEWYKWEGPLPTDQNKLDEEFPGSWNTDTLLIDPVDRSQKGYYYAKFNNSSGEVNSTQAELNVLYQPYIDVQPNFTGNIMAGDPLTLNTTVDSNPGSTFQWYKDGNPIANQTSEDLNISLTTINDNGDYHLVATNPHGTATSNTVTVDIHDEPRISLQPQSLNVEEGNAAVLRVEFSGKPAPSIQWLKDGSNYNSNINTGSGFSEISISSTDRTDSGNYSVQLTNAYGTATSQVATLDVQYQPTITLQPGPTPQYKEAGVDDFAISIAGEGNPSPQVKWYHNSNLLSESSFTFSISAANLKLSHAGTYNAKLVNFVVGSERSMTSQNVELIVHQRPINLTGADPIDLELIAGQDGNFEVDFSGIPTPTLQWYKVETTDIELTGETNNTLNFTNVTPADTGLYKVCASNTIKLSENHTVCKDNFNLTVYYPPIITAQPQPSNIIKKEGDNLNLSVAADSLPANQVFQWFFNSVEMEDEENANLNKANLSREDSGSYYVQVTNDIGSTQSDTVTLDVQYPPEITEQPFPLVNEITEGENFSVSAEYNSNPVPTIIQWKFDDGTGGGFVDVPGQATEVLNLTNVNRDQHGQYKLHIENTYGAENLLGQVESNVVNLIVNFAPEILPGGQPIGSNFTEGDFGSNYTLSIMFEGRPMPEVQWVQIDITGKEKVLIGENNSDLVITDLNWSHRGQYFAIIKNKIGEVKTLPATIEIDAIQRAPASIDNIASPVLLDRTGGFRE